MTDDMTPEERMALMRHEIAEVKSRPLAAFHPDYDGAQLQAELDEDLAALLAEAEAMLKQMGPPPTHDIDSMTRMIGGPPHDPHG